MLRKSWIGFAMLMALYVTQAAAQGPLSTPALLDRDDFSRYAPGRFGEYVKPGFPEYHHVPREYMGGWEVVNNRGPEEWKIFLADSTRVLEYLGYNSSVWTHDYIYPMLVRGDRDWSDYAAEVTVTPFTRTDLNGVVFRYQDGRHYYLFALGAGDTLTLRARDGEKGFREDGWVELATGHFATDPMRRYCLRVEAFGDRISCFIDGQPVLQARDRRFDSGKIGLFTTCPARYHGITVSTTGAENVKYQARTLRRGLLLDSLRHANPQPVVWKRIKLGDSGAARAIRLGDLDGDGRLDLLLIQNIPYFGGNYNRISCMTALDLDGRLLWQWGLPDTDHAWLSYDPAVQIHDLDGDGTNEIVFADGEWIKVLEGATGKEKARYGVPESKILPGESSWLEYKHYYRRDLLPFLNVDCFAFCDLRGTGKPQDVIIKDRHTRLWAFTTAFKPLWTATANLSHYPSFLDVDHDGKDEVLIGFSLFDDNGRQLWTLDDQLQEHADGILAADLSLSGKPPKVFISASDDGVAVADLSTGKLLKHHRVGHAQTPTVGNFRPDVPGLEYCNINYWGEPGMITLYDSNGDEIIHFEPFHGGSPVLPVNWRGDGSELICLSTSPDGDGGLYDGWGRSVVQFPSDGHPDLAYEVHDLTGDARDEIITWDPQWLWIYTQDRDCAADSVYAPKRPPLYNESNYRPIVSMPGWEKKAK